MPLIEAYLLILLCLGLYCGWLHRRSAPPVALYLAATGAIFGCAAGVIALSLVFPDGFSALTLYDPGKNGAYQDTYYVVINTPMQLTVLALVLSPLALVWFQGRLRALIWPGLVRWLFWPLFLGLICGTALSAALAIWGMPQTYTGFDTHMARVSWAYTASVALGLAGFAGLVLQAAIGLARRFGRAR